MQAAGKNAGSAEIEGPNGHLNGVIHIVNQGEAIRAFLAK